MERRLGWLIVSFLCINLWKLSSSTRSDDADDDSQDLQAHDYAVLQLPIAAPRIDRTPHLEGNAQINRIIINSSWRHALVLVSICSEHFQPQSSSAFPILNSFCTWEAMKMTHFAAFRSVHEALQGRESRTPSGFGLQQH